MHYHLIGICGAAMASLAGMLQARGAVGYGFGLERKHAHVHNSRGAEYTNHAKGWLKFSRSQAECHIEARNERTN